eukprot:CAMPEP_0197834610 /NCGR_PEP_ID=MMETSP1437-20131217/23059_1 /TAXON_ID=49252 ORGANISM="Eucampia antarctica, Strain CCMP1452" /NCGR_SAMPLE_ID=MMETSP1437 /ASSEMBLY_ACC=CAM_ASM_001096 /LENGTH=229 /DNA_ID=CAMNT_0043439435 /DNA_START=164 /DNA_END=854 /DNA_ORIENTATION=-
MDSIHDTKVNSNNVSYKEIIGHRKTIISILDQMSRHLGSEGVQEKGCMTLWLLSEVYDIKFLIADLNGVTTILIALQCHLKCLTLQEAGLGVLTSMSTIPELKDIISDKGGVDVVLCTLWVNVGHENIVIGGLIAMSNMCVNSKTNEIDLIGYPEVELIVVAMMDFRMSSQVQLCACRLLRNLALANQNVNLMAILIDQLTGALEAAANNFPSECGERVDFILDRLLSV